MSIGLEAIQKYRVVNLRALSKNSKKKIDKKSGRKQPRVNDYEIELEPAPLFKKGKLYYRCLINRVVTFFLNYCFIVFDIYRRYFSVVRY
jgi:hypothetical protein